ncbi:MAG: Nudix family hydrolase [Gallionella sp.]|nr:Nudix family hydrolase [Gallionella sp.]
MTSTKIIAVAAAVLLRMDGTFLLAQRPAGKAFEGYWEFPGGKLEAGETAHLALCRELQEELGITVTRAHPWLTRTYTYTHATVKLHFFRVYEWMGEPAGMEGQELSWQTPNALTVSPILPANAPILRAISLPSLYAISNAVELGNEVFLERLEQALIKGLRLVQIREAHLSPSEMLEFTHRAVSLAHRYGALVMVNSDIELAKLSGADGVHFTGKQLLMCTERPDMTWCSASCHNEAELAHAGRIGFDFAMLSPVLPTLSHPGAAHLGWEKFAEIINGTTLPVYALGGLIANDLGTAQEHGAHGIALLRQAWI